MISLEDLGLTRPGGTSPGDSRDGDGGRSGDLHVVGGGSAEKVEEFAPVEPAAGSATAAALYQTWSGNPVTIVNSPPGAGKTTLVTQVVHWLSERAELEVVIATPTVAAAMSVARRLVEVMGPNRIVLRGSSFKTPVEGVLVPASSSIAGVKVSEIGIGRPPVEIRTVASCRMSPPKVDVLVIDEAYQVSFADATAAAEGAEQVLLVGDPGQIGPTMTVDTTPWERSRIAPHHRSPEGFARRSDAVELHLPSTYRLGPVTTAAIAPLYEFEFDSARPDVAVRGMAEVESVTVPASHSVTGPEAMAAVVDRVEHLVGSQADSGAGSFTLGQADVAVLAARNEQTSMLTGLLRTRGLSEVTVGTADRLQGGQWAAAVAVDPFYGSPVGSSHSRSLGRLCVMTSRHIAHLTWVTSDDWRDVIAATSMDDDERDGHVAVREALTAEE
ncbi:AAA family ATPase [Pseudactinotalea sp. HY160]|uniref:AAA family ATPase n=1 Tax=Pseudactinotalea sp. HY160 TaxID=2654490 RepID=UPI001883E62C|nr:AAA family ATPase [Pseudactinotalea sp. HY160]